jgi:hypothetical protein
MKNISYRNSLSNLERYAIMSILLREKKPMTTVKVYLEAPGPVVLLGAFTEGAPKDPKTVWVKVDTDWGEVEEITLETNPFKDA